MQTKDTKVPGNTLLNFKASLALELVAAEVREAVSMLAQDSRISIRTLCEMFLRQAGTKVFKSLNTGKSGPVCWAQ